VASPLGPVYSHRFDGNSIYHAMIAKVEKPAGFTPLSSYAWSKNIGDTWFSAQGKDGLRIRIFSTCVRNAASTTRTSRIALSPPRSPTCRSARADPI
jgi:hypothetical protein